MKVFKWARAIWDMVWRKKSQFHECAIQFRWYQNSVFTEVLILVSGYTGHLKK